MNNNSLRNSSTIKLMNILKIIAEQEEGLGITELSNKLDMNKSTIYRFVATLEESGYLEQNQSTQRYHYGIKMFELASKILNRKNWTWDIHPYLVDLKNRIQETVHLGVEDDGEVVYIDKVISNRSVQMYSQVGKRAPLYCTGIGKAILAHLPDKQRDEIIQQLSFHAFTSNTITNINDLQIEIKKIRAQGYSLDLEEHEAGVNCTAAPLFNFEGKVIGAISIAGPTSRVDESLLFDLAVETKNIAQLISRRLGSL